MRARPFSKRELKPVLSRDESARQGEAVRLASAAFGDSEVVRGFFNSYHSGLQARPLDLAVESAAGLERVAQAIGAVSAARFSLKQEASLRVAAPARSELASRASDVSIA